jgi:uncharacterized phage-associated protein
MPNNHVLDVAEYILSKQSTITAMKLQKLVYYGQAWHLAWTGKVLFSQPIQAWANGPVVKDLFDKHRGKYAVSPGSLGGDPANLSAKDTDLLDVVLQTYGPMSATQLSFLTHEEAPWQQARGEATAGAHSEAVISHASMQKYYKELSASDSAVHSASDVNFPAWA